MHIVNLEIVIFVFLTIYLIIYYYFREKIPFISRKEGKSYFFVLCYVCYIFLNILQLSMEYVFISEGLIRAILSVLAFLLRLITFILLYMFALSGGGVLFALPALLIKFKGRTCEINEYISKKMVKLERSWTVKDAKVENFSDLLKIVLSPIAFACGSSAILSLWLLCAVSDNLADCFNILLASSETVYFAINAIFSAVVVVLSWNSKRIKKNISHIIVLVSFLILLGFAVVVTKQGMGEHSQALIMLSLMFHVYCIYRSFAIKNEIEKQESDHDNSSFFQ